MLSLVSVLVYNISSQKEPLPIFHRDPIGFVINFKHFQFLVIFGKKLNNTTIYIFLFLFILWALINSSSELSHYIQYTFSARTVTSYLKDANLTSLSQRCRLRRVIRSRISLSCLLDWFFNDRRLSSLFLHLSHSWQVSTLNFLKLRTSFYIYRKLNLFVYNMQLYIQKQLSHIVCNLSNFSQHCSKSGNQGDLKTPIEDISLTYKLISPMQLGNFLENAKVSM